MALGDGSLGGEAIGADARGLRGHLLEAAIASTKRREASMLTLCIRYTFNPDHRKNIARLEQSGAAVAMNRSFIQRVQHRS
jgi:hypothetical protein